MPIGVCYGRSSKTGFATAMMRDLDVLAPRAPLPKRALPDCVRAKLGLAGAPAAPALAPSEAGNAPRAAARPKVAVSKPRLMKV